MNGSTPVDLKETANLTTRLDRMPLTRTNLLISFLLLTVWLCEAFDFGIVAAILVFVKDLWQLTPTDQALLGVSATVGVAIGAGVAGRIVDIYGRKKVLVVGVAVFSIFTLACGFFPDKYWIIVCRFLSGLAIGAVYPIPYLIISELVGSKKRGIVIGACSACVAIFYAIPSLLGAWIVSNFPLEVAWRIPFFIGGLPLLLVFFLIKWIPESPRWSLGKGRVEEVRALVEKMENEAGLEHDTILIDPAVMRSLEYTHDTPRNGINAIIRPPYRLRLIISFCAIGGAGISSYILMVYAPMLFTEIVGATNAFKLTAALLFSGFLGAIVVEHIAAFLGRKVTFTIYSLLAVVGFIIVAHHNSLTMLITGGMIGSFFALGLVPFAKTYWPEQFPTHLRGLGAGLLESSTRAFAGILAAFFIPFIFASSGVGGVYWVAAIAFLVCLVPFLIWGRETAGLSMEEASQVSTVNKVSACQPEPSVSKSVLQTVNQGTIPSPGCGGSSES